MSTLVGRSKHPYHHGDLRNALIEQAVKLVEQAGADRFSLREAARLLGVSANAAYRHFADKSDLLMAVAEIGHRRQERCILRALSAVSDRLTPADAAVERLKATGRGYAEFAVEHPEMLRLMFGTRALPNSGLPKTAAYALLSKALDDLVTEGILPTARRAGAELKAWTVVHGFAMLVLQGVGPLQKRAERASALSSILDFAFIGLCGHLK